MRHEALRLLRSSNSSRHVRSGSRVARGKTAWPTRAYAARMHLVRDAWAQREDLREKEGGVSEAWHAEIDVLPEYVMRAPCRHCGEASRGRGPRVSNGQAVVFCAECRRSVYNAPKTETGTPQRNIKSRPDLRPGQRERILERDGGECFLCHRRDGILHVAHALSVADAKTIGVPEEEYMDDANLYASCEECNLGLKSRSMEARIFLRLIQLRLSKNGAPR